MFSTKHGVFSGKTWESLCQLAFKMRYEAEGYQQMPADPGDFGLEGFTLNSGYGFQCYCPEKQYDSAELYEKQRDKITADLNKLKKNQHEIKKRIGNKTLCKWVFVTPVCDKNLLLVHARVKEKEVQGWKLPILDDDFTVHIHDVDFYSVEIGKIRLIDGTSLSFDDEPPELPPLVGPSDLYESNIKRKSEFRLAQNGQPVSRTKLERLYDMTLKSFLECDAQLRRINSTAPTVYFRLVRLINEFENEVMEKSATSVSTPEELTDALRESLSSRISSELGNAICPTDATKVARMVVARWLAVCALDFTD